MGHGAGQKTAGRLCGGDVVVECHLLDLLLLFLIGARSGLGAPPLGFGPSGTLTIPCLRCHYHSISIFYPTIFELLDVFGFLLGLFKG